jgi:aminoglycoside phosphotransferase
VFPFPLDARIKYLPLAADRKKVRRRFFGRRCSVQTLRYVPARRCQLLYRSRSGEVLGKIFRDERGQTLFQTMEQVAARFTSHGDRLLWAPRPIQYLPDWQMLIQEKAPGRTLYEMIQDGSARDRHIEAAARSLAVLHGASLVPGSLYAVSDEIQLLEWSVRSLQALEIGEAPFAPSLDRIRAFGRRLRCSAPVPVHRDFYDKQLLMEGDAAALIDLDTLALGQAEIDVANFLAHLRLRSREERWQDLFLDCYRRTAPAPPDERLLCFFLSTTYFRLACKNRIHTGDGEAPCDRLLELAGDALGGV